MKTPIPLILDLWAYGCSASAIAGVLGLKNAKHVTRVIDHARSIGDPRAVVHAFKDGRSAGRQARAEALKPAFRAVVLIQNRYICRNGHRLTKANSRLRSNGMRSCRVCIRKNSRLFMRARRAEAK